MPASTDHFDSHEPTRPAKWPAIVIGLGVAATLAWWGLLIWIGVVLVRQFW